MGERSVEPSITQKMIPRSPFYWFSILMTISSDHLVLAPSSRHHRKSLTLSSSSMVQTPKSSWFWQLAEALKMRMPLSRGFSCHLSPKMVAGYVSLAMQVTKPRPFVIHFQNARTSRPKPEISLITTLMSLNWNWATPSGSVTSAAKQDLNTTST